MRTLKDEIDDFYQNEPKYQDEPTYERAYGRYPSPGTLLWLSALLILMLGVAWLGMHEVTRPPHVKPWWYRTGNQLDWELTNRVTPKGYDNVSRYFISSEGIATTRWTGEKSKIWTGTFNRQMQMQWVGDRLLIRTNDGKTGFFSGDEQIHLPLQGIDKDDMLPEGKKLVDCLHPDDKGLVLEHEEKPGLLDVMWAEGVLDESTCK